MNSEEGDNIKSILCHDFNSHLLKFSSFLQSGCIVHIFVRMSDKGVDTVDLRKVLMKFLCKVNAFDSHISKDWMCYNKVVDVILFSIGEKCEEDEATVQRWDFHINQSCAS